MIQDPLPLPARSRRCERRRPQREASLLVIELEAQLRALYERLEALSDMQCLTPAEKVDFLRTRRRIQDLEMRLAAVGS